MIRIARAAHFYKFDTTISSNDQQLLKTSVFLITEDDGTTWKRISYHDIKTKSESEQTVVAEKPTSSVATATYPEAEREFENIVASVKRDGYTEAEKDEGLVLEEVGLPIEPPPPPPPSDDDKNTLKTLCEDDKWIAFGAPKPIFGITVSGKTVTWRDGDENTSEGDTQINESLLKIGGDFSMVGWVVEGVLHVVDIKEELTLSPNDDFDRRRVVLGELIEGNPHVTVAPYAKSEKDKSILAAAYSAGTIVELHFRTSQAIFDHNGKPQNSQHVFD